MIQQYARTDSRTENGQPHDERTHAPRTDSRTENARTDGIGRQEGKGMRGFLDNKKKSVSSLDTL